MADKCDENSSRPENGRNLCLMKGKSSGYRGYKKELLIENLSERENTMFVCIRCEGIVREVCISSGGEQFCSSCKGGNEQIHPNSQMDSMVLSFKCSCPLIARGCDWLGTLGGCQEHLDTCGYVLEACKLRCGVVLQRDELKVHEKEKCSRRVMKCEHCQRYFQFCELSTHFNECPKVEVSCELKCGVVMCREAMPSHVEKECGLVVELCELGCGVVLTRNELRMHVMDTCVNRVVLCEHCWRDFKFCYLAIHHDDCPKINVSCKLCGIVMCREDMAQHMEQDCVEKEIECPFVKYKCEVVSIKRKYLSQHLDEKRTEHLELKLNVMEMKQIATELKLTKMEEFVMKQNKTVEKQNMIISEQSSPNRKFRKNFE